MLLIMAVTLYTSRVVLNQLGIVDYGIYNVVGGIVVMFSFLNGAMAQSTQRFLSYEMGKGNSARLQKTFSAAMSIHLLIAAIILFFSETIGLWFLNAQMKIPTDRIIAANVVYQCSILSFLTSIIQVPYNASIISHEKMQVYAYISIIEVALKLGVAFSLLIILEHRLILYAVMILAVTIIINLTYRFYCNHNFTECNYKWMYDKELFHSMSGYAVWSSVGSFAWIGKSQGCNLILNIFLGTSINAAYGITNQVNTALNSFVQNFTTAINPQIVKSYAINDHQRSYSLVYNGCKFSFFLMLILAVPTLIITEQILTMWLKIVPEYTVVFTQLIIINSLFESFAYCMSMVLQASGKIKTYQIVVGITTLLNLPFTWLLLNFGYQPYYIFIISIIISIITLFERLLIMRYTLIQFSIRSFSKHVFIPGFIVSVAVCTMCMIIVLLKSKGYLGVFETVTLSFISTTILVFFLGFNVTERQSMTNIIKSKFH